MIKDLEILRPAPALVQPGMAMPAGPRGESAYELARANGFPGSLSEYLESLKSTQPGPTGLSAYQVAVSQGFSGSPAQWLESLKGEVTQTAFDGLARHVDDQTYFVVAGMDPTEGSDITNAIARGRAAGYRKMFIERAGNFQARQLDLPDYEPNSPPWGVSQTFTIIGRGEETTIVSQIDPLAKYLLGQPSFRGTTDRGQSSGIRIGDMTLKGLSQPGNDQPLIALSNTAKPQIFSVTVGGNQAGALIEFYAHQKGGLWSGRLDNVSAVRQMYDTTITGAAFTDPFGNNRPSAFYDINELRTNRGRSFLRLNGPRDATGKVNDVSLYGCDVNNMLVSVIDTTGHGAYAALYPGGGGADNINVDKSNFFAAQGTRKIEEGLIDWVSGDGLTIRLRQDKFLHSSLDVFKNCSIIIMAPDKFEYGAYINTMTAGTRECAIDRVIPGAAAGVYYRIQYGDEQMRLENWHPLAGPCGLYWEPWLYRARFQPRCEEIMTVVAHTGANNKVAILNQYRIVDFANPCIRIDGTSFAADTVAGCVNPQGGGDDGLLNANSANFYRRIVGDGVDFRDKKNGTGITVFDGDVVRYVPNTPGTMGPAVDYTTANAGRHAIMVSPSGYASRPNKDMACVVPGQETRVNVINDSGSPLTVLRDMFAVAKAGVAISGMRGGVTAVAEGSLTAEQKSLAVGRFLAASTIAPNTVVKLRVLALGS